MDLPPHQLRPGERLFYRLRAHEAVFLAVSIGAAAGLIARWLSA